MKPLLPGQQPLNSYGQTPFPSLLPKSPITVSLGWVKRGNNHPRVCDCAMAPLPIPPNDELLAIGRVKRGPSLSKNLFITMGNWSDMILYRCFMLQLILSPTPHHTSVQHGFQTGNNVRQLNFRRCIFFKKKNSQTPLVLFHLEERTKKRQKEKIV